MARRRKGPEDHAGQQPPAGERPMPGPAAGSSAEAEHLLGELREANRRLTAELARERKIAMRARARSAQWNALLTGLSEGVAVIDAADRIVLMNPAARELLGIPRGTRRSLAQIREGIDMRLLDGRPIPFDERPLSLLRRGEGFSDFEAIVVLPDGTRRHLVFAGGSVRDEAGRAVLAILAYRDVTRLRELERMREEYVSLISHDLRAPLTIVLGRADLLRRQILAVGRSDEAQSAEAILRNARRMDAMIQDLVDTARLEAGLFELRRTPTNLVEIVRAVVEGTISPTDRSRVQIETTEPLPAAEVDRARIERVVTNFLVNALKYSPPGSPVTVRIACRDWDEIVTVTDYGAGIASEDLPLLFQKYHRTTVGRRAGGLGLGLYIARLIIEASGGRIWVNSALGQGSTFGFSLPIRHEC